MCFRAYLISFLFLFGCIFRRILRRIGRRRKGLRILRGFPVTVSPAVCFLRATQCDFNTAEVSIARQRLIEERIDVLGIVIQLRNECQSLVHLVADVALQDEAPDPFAGRIHSRERFLPFRLQRDPPG